MPEPHQQRAPDCAILRVPGLGGLHLLHATRDDRSAGTAQRSQHRHDIWHCVAYTSGRGTCLLDGNEVAVRSPYIILTSPGQPHCFSRRPGENAVYHEVTFAPDKPSAVTDWSNLLYAWTGVRCALPSHRPCPIACADDIGAIAGRIAAVVRDGRAESPALFQGLLAETLLTVFRHLVADAERAAPDGPLELARRFIEHHAEDSIDLDAVADAAGLSAKHLSRAFAVRYGDPPMRYRRRLLMRRAAVLLRTSDASVERIAAGLGFADWRHFSRCFRAEHRVSPANYRRG
ncbi:MAG: AraC family transcriptional regulator [Planctomycetota bacterium]